LKFLQNTLELSRRGDIFGITKSLTTFFQDKKLHPWHRIHSILDDVIEDDEKPKNLMLVRDSFFGALDMLSLSLALDVPTEELIEIFTKQKSWKEARRKIRSHCSMLISRLISKLDVYHLDAKGLEHDGFSYLVADLVESQIEVFRRGRPEIENRKGTEYLLLKKLHRSKIGRKLLREQGISEDELTSTDPRFTTLQEALDLTLVELELESSDVEISTGPTEQVTLNGKPVEDIEIPHEREKEKEIEGVQKPLTEFFEEPQTKSKSKPRERAAKRREKKKMKSGWKK